MSVQINVQASQSALAQSIAQGVAAFNSRYAGQNQLNLQINARNFSQPLGRITSDLADFESALKASNARVLAFGASTAVLGGVVRSFKEIANVTIEVEKSLTDINRVLNLSTNNLQKFSSELFSISKQTASSFDDATKAALEFSRQGLNTEETLKRTADALTLVRLTGISSTKAVEDLTATINGFAKAGLTTSQVVNKLAAVEQDFAVSATDLTEALSRTGQAAQEAGVSFDELNALVTTAQQNTARGGAVIGNALKTIFTRLQRTETLDQLQNFNIAVRDIEGNILPAVQILKNFADRYNDLADAQRAQLSEQVAGVYQVNILKGVIKDLNNNQGTYVQALQRGAMAANEADVANQRLNKTLSALVTQTGIGLQQLANNVGKVTFAPIFEAIVSPVNDAVSYINDTLEGEGIGSIFANGLLKGVRNVIAGPGLAVAFAVIAKVAKNTFEDATKALPAILGLTTEAQKRANIEKSIISILQTQSNLSLALQGQQGNLSTQAATVLNYARLQTAQYQQQLQIAQQLAPLLAAQNVTVGTRGIQVGPRIKAGGHIPAFAEMSERMGAAMGGYKSGKVVKAPKSVGANTYMNSAEEVKYISGFAQPFINPPAGSKAGRAHRKNAINRTGIDPYMFRGFIPNFASNYSDWSWSPGFAESIMGTSKKKNNSNPTFAAGRVFENVIAIASKLKQKYSEDNATLDYYPISFGPGLALEKQKLGINKETLWGDAKLSESSINLDSYISKVIRSGNGTLEKNNAGTWKLKATTEGGSVILPKTASGSDKSILHKTNKQKLIAKNPTIAGMLSNISDDDVISSSLFLDRTEVPLIETFVAKGSTKKETAEKLVSKFKSGGFIPNFAPPISMLRIPWFKKYANPSFDAKQPIFNIAGANSTDTFRSTQFRTNKTDYNKKAGDGNIFGPTYEKFVRSAISLQANKSKIKSLILGQSLEPDTVQGESSFDAFMELANSNPLDLLDLVGIEIKGGPKDSQTGGSATSIITKKYNNFATKNPKAAARLKELLGVFNEPGHPQHLQYMSALGKEFLPLAATSYDEIAKNSPQLVQLLSQKTNELLTSYVNDPSFFKATSSGGFIPNFAKFKSRFGTATLGKTDPIDLEFFGKTLGRKIKPSDIVSIEDLTTKGKGNASNLYSDIANSIKGKGGIFGYALAQNRSVDPSKAKDPLAKLKAKYPQIAKRIGLGGETFISGDYGQNIVKASTMQDLIKYQDQILKMIDPAVLTLKSFANGFIPNFAGKDVMTKFFKTQTGPDLFSSKGTGLSGTVYKQPGYRSYGYQLKEQLNNMVMSILGNNVFFPDASSLNPKLYGDVNKGAENFAKNAALKLSSAGKTSSLGLGSGMMSEAFGNSRLNFNPEAVYTGQISGKMKRVNYDRLSDVLGAFWSANPQTKSAWESLKNLSESGKFEEKESIRAKTSLLKKAYEEFLIKNNYIGTRVKLSSYRKRAEGVEGVNYGSLRSDLAGVSDVRNLGKNNGFIPNFAYKQSVMGLEESMSGNKAIFDTKPFPHIRNSSQPNFASAISDHGGLKNALNDSMRNQEAAGLMSNGFVPNFAVVKARQSLGADFGSLSKTEQTLFLQLNIALTKLAKDTTLTSQQQQALQNTIQNNALMLQQSTKSINIVNDANNALVKSLQENAQAQSAAAQATKAATRPSGPRAAQQTLSTRIGGLFGGKRGAVYGRRFDEKFNNLSNNVGFTLAAPMVGGILESAIGGGRDRSEMGYVQRLASSGASAALTGVSTGAAIGSAIPGIGTAAGAVIGGLTGLVGAALNAKTTLDDLSKSASLVAARSKEDIDSAKKLLSLQTQLASESDPYKIEELQMQIQETSLEIKDSKFAERILQSGTSVEKFNKAILDFSKSVKPLETLARLPESIKKISEITGLPEQGGFVNIYQDRLTKGFLAYSDAILEVLDKTLSGNSDKIKPQTSKILSSVTGPLALLDKVLEDEKRTLSKASTLAKPALASFANLFIDLESEVKAKKPELLNDYNDLIKNLFTYREQGALPAKLENFYQAGLIDEQTLAGLLLTIEKITNSVYVNYIEDFEKNIIKEKSRITTRKVNVEKIKQDLTNLKNIVEGINLEVQKSLNDIAISLLNVEFQASIRKLNIEKIGGIFDTAASAIAKNLEGIAKIQFDNLMLRMESARQNQLAEIDRTQFDQKNVLEQDKFLNERRSRVAKFLVENAAQGEKSREEGLRLLNEVSTNLNFDFEKLNTLVLQQGNQYEVARKNIIEAEKFEQRKFKTERSNAEFLFKQDQNYAKIARDNNVKFAEENQKLEERKLDNLRKQRDVAESFSFANRLIEIQTQANIDRMSIPMEVNPNFFAGMSRFQQEDIRFQQERQKAAMELSAGIRTATNQANLANFEMAIMQDNISATKENTDAIRTLTLEFFAQRETGIRNDINNLLTNPSSRNIDDISQFIRRPDIQESSSRTESPSKLVNFIKNKLDENAETLFRETMFKRENLFATQTEPIRPIVNQKTDDSIISQLFKGWKKVLMSKEEGLPSIGRNFALTAPFYSKQANANNRMNQTIDSLYTIPALNEGLQNEIADKQYFRFYNNPGAQTKKSENIINDINQVPSAIADSEPFFDKIGFDRLEMMDEVKNSTSAITDQARLQLELKNQELETVIRQKAEYDSIFSTSKDINRSRVENAIPDISELGTPQQEIQLLKDSETALRSMREEDVNKLKNAKELNLSSQQQEALVLKISELNARINSTTSTRLDLERRITNENERQAAYKKYLESRGKFSTGVANAVGKIREETEMFKETLGTTTVNAFRDGLVGAMDAALNKADDLESALMGVAASFLREIQGVVLRNIANQAISSIMPSFGSPTGGSQKGGLIRAQKGMYISGGRTGDKNPALLEDGEYVLNRNAVKALGGPRAIDDLNFNAFPRFADGGDMSASIAMSEPFQRLSMYGREQSPEFQNYIGKLREEEAIRDKKRAERKALINSLITTAVTTGLMMGISSGVKGLKTKFGSKTPLNKVAGSKPNLAQRAQLKKAGVPIGPDGFPAMQTGGAIGFNQGGFLPYGSRLTDSIPAYLTGGEYVVNSRAVRKYGVGGLNRINSGVAKFQDGGMVGTETGSPSNTSNTANNNVSINITVNASGGKVNDQESDSNNEGTEGNAKELSNRIKAVVLDVITTEQRTGGLLDSTKKR